MGTRLDAAEPHPKDMSSRARFGGGPRPDGNGETTATMRIRTDSSASSASLVDYLTRCGCAVAVIDRCVIEATAKPDSFAVESAEIELEGYLKVWEAMHPHARLERLSPRRELSPPN
jgi:hypothetical protein